MKTTLRISLLAVGAALYLGACNQPPKGDNAEIGDAEKAAKAAGQTFMVDTADSHIRFTGHGVGKNHPGKFRLSSGTVAVADNQITGGNFLIDIKSMDMEQEGDMIRDKLLPHLLSGDFFDADKFGNARFVITKVEPYKADSAPKEKSLVEGANYSVSGNLTIKETTKNVTFPARIDLDDNTLKAKANFDIDRTQWQMHYGNDKTLGDQFISETVNIELDLKAKAQGQTAD